MASIGEFLAALGHYNFLQSALLASCRGLLVVSLFYGVCR